MSLLLFAWALSLSLHSEPNGVRMDSHLQSCQVHLDTLHKERSCTVPPAILRFAMLWLILLNKLNLPNLLWECVQRSGPSTGLVLREWNYRNLQWRQPKLAKSSEALKLILKFSKWSHFLCECCGQFFHLFSLIQSCLCFLSIERKRRNYNIYIYIKKSQCRIKPWQLERKPNSLIGKVKVELSASWRFILVFLPVLVKCEGRECRWLLL